MIPRPSMMRSSTLALWWGRAGLKSANYRFIITGGVRNCNSRPVPPTQSDRQKALRTEFLEQEKVFESQVDLDALSPDELSIHHAHREAIEGLHFTYDDPETGLKVITRLRHFLKKTCCGNACRHCIYNHQNVDPIIAKRRMFNTAFWINDPNYVEDESEEGFM